MLPAREQFTQSFPCSLVVFQYYTKKGFDSSFLALYQSFLCRDNDQENPLADKLSHRLHIPVSREKALRSKKSLSNSAALELNNALELIIRDMIRAAFLDDLDSCRRNGIKFKIKPVIDSALERMGFSEEAKSFDSVKKDLQRYCSAEGIDYSEEKKVRKPVPKVRANLATIAKEVENGVPMADFMRFKGISQRTFYRKYRTKIKTFFHRGCLFVDVCEFPEDALSFTVPK